MEKKHEHDLMRKNLACRDNRLHLAIFGFFLHPAPLKYILEEFLRFSSPLPLRNMDISVVDLIFFTIG